MIFRACLHKEVSALVAGLLLLAAGTALTTSHSAGHAADASQARRLEGGKGGGTATSAGHLSRRMQINYAAQFGLGPQAPWEPAQIGKGGGGAMGSMAGGAMMGSSMGG